MMFIIFLLGIVVIIMVLGFSGVACGIFFLIRTLKKPKITLTDVLIIIGLLSVIITSVLLTIPGIWWIGNIAINVINDKFGYSIPNFSFPI